MDDLMDKLRSRYNYWNEGDVIVMTDQNGDRSLTNDMENVIEYLIRAGAINSTNQKIIYKDSQGIWDGVELINLNPVSIDFYSINERDLKSALAKVKIW
jgi:hypothetical protein